MSRKNIVLEALFVRSDLHDWSIKVTQLRAELLLPIEPSVDENLDLSLTFRVNLLVADLGAKSHIFTMFKVNGFCGCHYYTAEGKNIGKSHSFAQKGTTAQKGRIREPISNNMYIKKVENEVSETVANVVGVKGKSAFASLLDGLPSTAPDDYMCCVLIGVFSEVLKHKKILPVKCNQKPSFPKYQVLVKGFPIHKKLPNR